MSRATKAELTPPIVDFEGFDSFYWARLVVELKRRQKLNPHYTIKTLLISILEEHAKWRL